MNMCIACGQVIPEGFTVCWRCLHDPLRPVFLEELDALRYAQKQGWKRHWIRRMENGYIAGEVRENAYDD